MKNIGTPTQKFGHGVPYVFHHLVYDVQLMSKARNTEIEHTIYTARSRLPIILILNTSKREISKIWAKY